MEQTINPYWNLKETQLDDRSTISYEYQEYKVTGNVNDRKKFAFKTSSLDIWYHLYNSYLTVKLKLQKDGQEADINATILNNIFNIFIKAELFFGVKLIETVDYVGLKTLIEGLVEFSEDFLQGSATDMFWFKDTSRKTDISPYKYFGTLAKIESKENGETFVEGINSNPSFNEGFLKRFRLTKKEKTINVVLPLSRLFGFINSYTKLMKGVEINIRLETNEQSDMVHQSAITPEYNVIIEDMSLWIPHVEPSLTTLALVTEQEKLKPELDFVWLGSNVYILREQSAQTYHWRVGSFEHKPTGIFLTFQYSDYENNRLKNNMIFENMDLITLEVKVNGKKYPQEELKCNFKENDYVRAYMNFKSAGNKTNNVDSGSIVSYEDFKSLYPIFYIDVSKFPDSLYDVVQTAEIVIAWKFGTSPTRPYSAICKIDSEKSLMINPINMRGTVIN